MFVACKLPAGLIIRQDDVSVTLNGTNTGLDPALLPANGAAPDGPTRSGGWGVTEVTGDEETALKEWFDTAGKGEGPVAAGAIFTAASRRELDAKIGQAKASAQAFEGLDPATDLPAGVETASDKKN